ncbi:MAG: Gfo/Idh/MocA family oxidoreductase [Bryobacterales bacterium]|nr:Gfo/Idh/MocA family oxidoreductase [Bryobacterales bacterium]
MESQTRRTFLGAVAAAPFAATVLGANEKVNLALIGARNQGRGVAMRSIAAGARIKTICDIDDAIYAKVAPELGKAQGSTPQHVKDFRKVLEDKDVDAVIIATPDHWHTHMALLACQAGKDVYLEKPVSQTIHEGHLIKEAARKYKRVMQIGTMRRSGDHFRTAAEFVGSGKLGKVCLVKAWMCQERKTIGRPADSTPPAGADYEAWLGPAPKRPFNVNRFHYNWRFFWDYGNSELGNQGVHMLDIALWGIEKMRGGLERCLPTRVSSQAGIYWLDDAKEVPDTQTVTYDFGDFMLLWELRSFNGYMPIDGTRAGTAFYGTDGTLVVDAGGWTVTYKDGSPGPSAPGAKMIHEANFLECLKTREMPHADIEIGRLSTTLTHLGNISHHLGRDIRFDPKTETFGHDKEANGRLRKEYRKGYELPKV